jgi:hypothetical protein
MITAGTRLGPYEILAPLGAGGMGEVYLASDPRLGREVAIKICSARFSERFEREARSVAALTGSQGLICRLRSAKLRGSFRRTAAGWPTLRPSPVNLSAALSRRGRQAPDFDSRRCATEVARRWERAVLYRFGPKAHGGGGKDGGQV